MTKPSDRAIAMAFREWMSDGSQEWRDNHPAEKWVPDRAREIDAAAPDGAQFVTGTVAAVGSDESGQPRILIHTTREALRDGPMLACRDVFVSTAVPSSPDGAQAVASVCLVTHRNLPHFAAAEIQLHGGYEPKIGDKLYTAPPSQDAEDAARYRWIRSATEHVEWDGFYLPFVSDIDFKPGSQPNEVFETLDAAIDAVRAARGGG